MGDCGLAGTGDGPGKLGPKKGVGFASGDALGCGDGVLREGAGVWAGCELGAGFCVVAGSPAGCCPSV